MPHAAGPAAEGPPSALSGSSIRKCAATQLCRTVVINAGLQAEKQRKSRYNGKADKREMPTMHVCSQGQQPRWQLPCTV